MSQLPDEAPGPMWGLVLGVLALWWLWPWIERAWSRPAVARSLVVPEPPVPEVELIEEPSASAASPEAPATLASAPAPESLDFLPEEEFRACFAEVARHISEALAVPPRGAEYTLASAALNHAAEVLDRLLKAFGSGDLARVSRLREGIEAFKKSFGEHPAGKAARGILASAGFQREVVEGTMLWIFYANPRSRLRALTAKLCLRKLSDNQRLRGSARWAQSSNETVVPSVEQGSLSELLLMYRSEKAACDPLLNKEGPAAPASALRERVLEAAIRSRLNERREGLPALIAHEGLAGVARALAASQRLKSRQSGGDERITPPADAEVRALLQKLPLPPGFSVATLYFQSTELPHIFGLESSTGSGSDASAGEGAAEVLSKEALGQWTVRQPQDVAWASAAVYGVGGVLDYTLNRGFMVCLLAGFEGAQMDTNLVENARELRRRTTAKPSTGPVSKLPSFGAKVRTLDSPHTNVKLQRKAGG